MLVATMENDIRGNYQPGGAGVLPAISTLLPEVLSVTTWQQIISNLNPKTGKHLIVTGGHFDSNTSTSSTESTTPPSEGGSSSSDSSGSSTPPTTTPQDCIGMRVNGYEVTLAHGRTGRFSREEYGTPQNGKTIRKISASCHQGVVTLGNDEETTVECIAPYRRKEIG